jgi:Arc/MetJ family transcription regulator
MFYVATYAMGGGCRAHVIYLRPMKATFNIDDRLMAELKREAARQGRTMSELVETALRLLLRSPLERGHVPEMPIFHGGGTLVDIADRDALYQAMEGR